jgi:predicted aspartyl protease
MLHWVSGIAAALVASVVSVTPTSTDQPGMENAEVLKLDNERYERLTVPVTIDGEGPFDFMVDTGAQATVISDELAQQLQLFERSNATLVGMASRRPIETVAVDDIEVGSRNFSVATAPIVTKANIGSADGILGLDSLQDQRVLIDFDKNSISVADAQTLGGNSGYEIIVKARRQLGQLIITQAYIGGVKVAVLVDTGAQGTIGNMALLRKIRSSEHSTTELTDINGVKLGGSVRIARTLDIGRARMANLPVFFAESPTFHALGLDDEPALVLGMSELRLFRRVAIDFKSKRVLFDVPRAYTTGTILNHD